MYELDSAVFSRGSGIVKYPNPFITLSSNYTPITIKQLFRWTSYFFMTSPIINPIIWNLSEYPITQIVVDENDEKFKLTWQEVIENVLMLRSFMVKVGLDYHTYGNCIIYISFPIQKYLRCLNCKKREKIENCKYKFINMHFRLECKACQAVSEKAQVEDAAEQDIKRIKLMRINPELIDIECNEITGHRDYFITLPQYLKNQIKMGLGYVIENIPQNYIDVVREDKKLKLKPGEFFHLERPTISNKDLGWGRPLIEPILGMNYQLQTLIKAQEAILNGYILPLRVIFAQPPDGNAPPTATANLARFNSLMVRELERHRMDPNHIVISPIPVGSQIVGAEGKSLTLYQEIEAAANIICNGMGVPLELWKGGLSWTGSNMSLKLLENKFLIYRNQMLQLCRDFILKKICLFMNKPAPKISFSDFRMADDLQRSALLFQLFQSQAFSGNSLLQSLGHDYTKEQKFIQDERNKTITDQKKMQLATADIQGQAQLISADYALQAQKKQMMAGVSTLPQKMPEPAIAGLESPLSGEIGLDPNQLASRMAKEMEQATPEQKQMMQMQLQGNPDLLRMVNNAQLKEIGAQDDPLNVLQNVNKDIKPPRGELSVK